jgi:hypothetical protein
MAQRLLFCLILLFGSSACVLNQAPAAVIAAQGITPTSTAAPLPTSTPAGWIGLDGFPEGINPLTGLRVDPASLNRRPLVVKISNAPPLVRPQAGIGAADIVFEHYAEGGLTRFSAIYLGQAPERIGSIRSARLIDLELVPMFGALLGYSGASDGVKARLIASDFYERTYEGISYGFPYYWRDEAIDVPHNLFLNAAALWSLATDEGLNDPPVLRGFLFSPTLPIGSEGEATRLQVNYRATLVEWVYDPAMGLYRRSSDGLGHFDAITLEQITAANVVVLYADHHLTDIVESVWQGSISYSIEITLTGEGDAMLLRDGQRYTARWSRPARDAMIRLINADGSPLPLKPGNTWFQVFPLPEQLDPAEEAIVVDS